VIRKWFPSLDKRTVVISGPCSAESEEQLTNTAIEIGRTGKVDILRAGIWKPRTRPDTFEGVGYKGLFWLDKVKEKTNFITTVEVATPAHIENCLRHQVDILWIGARTSSNPFSVQELAEALKGVDIPVMVKNPLNPDIGLWIGAMERVYKAGIKKIAAVHRGFYPFEETSFRNIPKWEIPIELKTRFHNLSIVCDPSHIAGTTEYIQEISQRALDLNMDGLMIESHIDPKSAMSDASQQLNPVQLEALFKKLKYRDPNPEDSDFRDHLEQYREQIDSIDSQMIELLANRMNIVEQIGKYKSKNNVAILQLERWENILSTRTSLGGKLGLPKKFIKKMLQLIHKESITKQTNVMQKMNGSTDKK